MSAENQTPRTCSAVAADTVTAMEQTFARLRQQVPSLLLPYLFKPLLRTVRNRGLPHQRSEKPSPTPLQAPDEVTLPKNHRPSTSARQPQTPATASTVPGGRSHYLLQEASGNLRQSTRGASTSPRHKRDYLSPNLGASNQRAANDSADNATTFGISISST